MNQTQQIQENTTITHHTFSILNAWLHNHPLPEETAEFCTEANLQAIYALTKKHDLSHIAALVLDGRNLPNCETVKLFHNSKIQAIYRYAGIDYELTNIRSILEEARIPFIPLKGSVLRSYYPEPWMRTSCDIDILVREDMLEAATDSLVCHGWKVQGKKQYHDISLYSPAGVHLELHFCIKERMPMLDPILETVWQHCAPAPEKQFEQRMSNAFFLFHHIAHMSYHIKSGGCGIRPFLDLWLMMQHMPYDHQEFQQLINSAQLHLFWESMLELNRVWFDGHNHTELTQKLESYILTGGVYGSASYHITAKTALIGRRWKYLFRRIFLSYDLLIIQYPIGKKYKWLTPFLQVCRWFRLLANQKLNNFFRVFRHVTRLSTQEIQDMEDFLVSLGLSTQDSN